LDETPFIIAVFTGPNLALRVARAGGLGFIGPGATPVSTAEDLAPTVQILEVAEPPPFMDPWSGSGSEVGGGEGGVKLPLGVGF